MEGAQRGGSTSAHPHLSLLLPREMLGEEPRGLLEKGFKKRGCTPPFNPPEDVVLERDTHPRCKKRGARLISRELNLPSLT